MSDSRKPPRSPDQLTDAEWPTAIRFARMGMRLSQDDLGDRVGVGRGTVNAWENGKTPVGKGSRLALVKLFGDKLLDAPPPLDVSERAYWRGRVEQIAAHTRLLLDEQHQLAQEMHHPPRNFSCGAAPSSRSSRAHATSRSRRSRNPPAADAVAVTPTGRHNCGYCQMRQRTRLTRLSLSRKRIRLRTADCQRPRVLRWRASVRRSQQRDRLPAAFSGIVPKRLHVT